MFTKIREQWAGMLADDRLREESYQKFLSRHAGFFFQCDAAGGEQLVGAKIQLGSKYVTDFVIMCGDRSYGFKYVLTEIESPHSPPYTSAGAPSSRLNTAVQQVQDWQRWIERNREGAKRLFPSSQFTAADDPNFSFMIIIGRRQNSVQSQSKRNHYSRSIGVPIRSFDFLADSLDAKRFSAFTWISRDIAPNITAEDNNLFSNPFSRAYSDGDWRSIIEDGSMRTKSHMVAENLSLLLRHRRYNAEALSDFERYLASLTDEEKRIPEYDYQYLELM